MGLSFVRDCQRSGYFAKTPEQYKNNYYLGVVYVPKKPFIVLLINGSVKKESGGGHYYWVIFNLLVKYQLGLRVMLLLGGVVSESMLRMIIVFDELQVIHRSLTSYRSGTLF